MFFNSIRFIPETMHWKLLSMHCGSVLPSAESLPFYDTSLIPHQSWIPQRDRSINQCFNFRPIYLCMLTGLPIYHRVKHITSSPQSSVHICPGVWLNGDDEVYTRFGLRVYRTSKKWRWINEWNETPFYFFFIYF